jgi:uncharacterized paraquat-inducible protein A
VAKKFGFLTTAYNIQVVSLNFADLKIEFIWENFNPETYSREQKDGKLKCDHCLLFLELLHPGPIFTKLGDRFSKKKTLKHFY